MTGGWPLRSGGSQERSVDIREGYVILKIRISYTEKDLMDEPPSEEAFLASYDPRAFEPVAVTVDVVALTVRADRLQVLLRVLRAQQELPSRLPAS